MEWTTEAVRAEVNYRTHGTMDRTSRLHLHEVRRAPWWRRLSGQRPDPRQGDRAA
ncbi:hypothetical protein [Actinokineospora globicatena]|uniref:hypothetical protein n=1 Tax=Actinokineospora globicatena TaxID=103729 RepID=UPI0020A32261|nr:hypothetical protein [Actinokineospora globicatena]MCP2304424.1 hypothetical protein [Actinokineospora globicatena]GLW78210.1 hypothetical protein Aglo01_26920 [Actinokineospora globicatena]GLW85124.1 hypothetical protein Aglo02_27640 [Actinokineospora globicatena]